jgi:hypothetical protein
MRFVVYAGILREVVRLLLLLLDRLEQVALLAGTTQHEMVISVRIRAEVSGVEVLGERRAT